MVETEGSAPGHRTQIIFDYFFRYSFRWKIKLSLIKNTKKMNEEKFLYDKKLVSILYKYILWTSFLPNQLIC